MHGGELENCRLAVQPREIKFALQAASKGLSGARPGPPGLARSLRAPDPPPAHEDGLHRETAPREAAHRESCHRAAERALHQASPTLPHRTDLGGNLDDLATPHEAMRAASMRVLRHVRGGGRESRKVRKNVRPLRSPRVLTRPQPESASSLFVEGNSMLAQDVGHASQALKHLSECVAEERCLRDSLEKAKDIKLKAFREVTRIYLSSLNTTSSPTAASSSTKPSRLLLPNPDQVALARCAVVSNTLLSTIQSYMRCWQSNQLIASLRRFPHLSSESNLVSNSDITSFLNTHPPRKDTIGEGTAGSSGSLEDLLDMEEISKLKQLYFDYFECEIVELDSEEVSDLRGSLRSDSTSESLTSILEV